MNKKKKRDWKREGKGRKWGNGKILCGKGKRIGRIQQGKNRKKVEGFICRKEGRVRKAKAGEDMKVYFQKERKRSKRNLSSRAITFLEKSCFPSNVRSMF